MWGMQVNDKGGKIIFHNYSHKVVQGTKKLIMNIPILGGWRQTKKKANEMKWNEMKWN